MESKLAQVAKLIRDVTADSQHAAETSTTKSQRSEQVRKAVQVQNAHSLRDFIADVELSIATRGNCTTALYTYFMKYKHVLKSAKGDPTYATALLELVNEVKENQHNAQSAKYHQIYLAAVNTIALLCGSTRKQSQLQAQFDAHSREHDAEDDDSPPDLQIKLSNATPRRSASDNNGKREEFVRFDRLDTLKEILSGQPIINGSTDGVFSAAFGLDPIQQTKNLQVR